MKKKKEKKEEELLFSKDYYEKKKNFDRVNEMEDKFFKWPSEYY